MRLAGTRRLKTGSLVEESWWTSFLVGVPRSQVPGSPSSRMIMQLPLMRGSSESTAAVTTLAKPMLVMKRPRLSTCSMRFLAVLPLGDAHLAGQHAGFDADEGDRFGEREGGADLLAIFAGLERRGAAHVVGALLRRAALVNGRKTEVARQAAGGRAGVHPGQLEGDQRQREILRPLDEPALLGIQERGGDAALVEVLAADSFLAGVHSCELRPPLATSAGDRAARHGTGGLHQHVQFVAVGKAPHDLADIVPGQGLQAGHSFLFGNRIHKTGCSSQWLRRGKAHR